MNARPAGVVEPDHGRAGLHGQIHDLADFLGILERQRPAENREVVRERIGWPAIDLAVAGHEAIARDLLLGHSEVDAVVRHQAVQFLERALV